MIEPFEPLEERRGHAVRARLHVHGRRLDRQPRLLFAHPRVDVEERHALAVERHFDLLARGGAAIEQAERLGEEVHAEQQYRRILVRFAYCFRLRTRAKEDHSWLLSDGPKAIPRVSPDHLIGWHARQLHHRAVPDNKTQILVDNKDTLLEAFEHFLCLP